MKISHITLAILNLVYCMAAAIDAEIPKTRAQLLKEGLEADGLDARDLISPGPPFLCQNGDPLHNASKWEYFEECLDVETCESSFGGYSVNGRWCGKPHDSSNRCCVESLCAAPYDSTTYACVDVNKWPHCNEVVGGKELCPGPESVRCCSSG